MGQRTAGDRLFEQYLADYGYAWQHEPDLGVTRPPDFLVERKGHSCVVEIKAFDGSTRSLPDRRGGTTSAEVVLKPLRTQLREAARQLKPLADTGLPLVVVLTNPEGALVFLDPDHVVYAMYGDPTVTMSIDRRTGAAVGDPQHVVGRNGRLARDHQYISAVAVLSEREHAADFFDRMRIEHASETPKRRWELIEEAIERGERPAGTYRRLTVIKTLSDAAAPLPEGFFAEVHDRVFEVKRRRGCLRAGPGAGVRSCADRVSHRMRLVPPRSYDTVPLFVQSSSGAPWTICCSMPGTSRAATLSGVCALDRVGDSRRSLLPVRSGTSSRPMRERDTAACGAPKSSRVRA